MKIYCVERFTRTLKSEISKYMTAVSKNVYTHKSDETVNKYNNKYHGKIKMKPFDVNPSMHIDFNIKEIIRNT